MSDCHTVPPVSQKVTNNVNLSRLLQFQSKFLSEVHSLVYSSTESTLEERLLKFRIKSISEVSEHYNGMIKQLTASLVSRGEEYEVTLRDDFQKILDLDFLPLLRINRHEIIQLALTGFDIYVDHEYIQIDPLKAILQVLNRVDGVKYAMKTEKGVRLQPNEHDSAWQSLQLGWQSYISFTQCWKLSFNVAMLKQYLLCATKSLSREHKDIVFTGCLNLFDELVPHFVSSNNIGALQQLAGLNNVLYCFHFSFDFLHFYTLFPLQDRLEPVFRSMQEVATKCFVSKTVTPLLLGILHNAQRVLEFVNQIQTIIWLPYLQAIIIGLLVNFKFRILEYEEVITILEAAIYKASLLGSFKMQLIGQTESTEWNEAKSFFLSAVKYASPPGEVQTWQSLQFTSIQSRLMKTILNCQLLSLQLTEAQVLELGVNKGEQLELSLQQLSKLKCGQLRNVYTHVGRILSCQSDICTLIQTINMARISKQPSISVWYYLITALQQARPENNLLLDWLGRASEVLNTVVLACDLEALNGLRDILPAFHRRFKPTLRQTDICLLYFRLFEPKKSIPYLIQILDLKDGTPATTLNCFVSSLVHTSIFQPQTKKMKVMTFDKQIYLSHDFINLLHRSHSCLEVLIGKLVQGKQLAALVLVRLVTVCKWIGPTLLSFPVPAAGQLKAFSAWLISHNHQLLLHILKEGKGAILTLQGKDYMQTVSNVSLCTQIIQQIESEDSLDTLHSLCKLLMEVHSQYCQQDSAAQQLNHEISSFMVFLLSKAFSLPSLVQIVSDFARAIELNSSHSDLWLDLGRVIKTEGQLQSFSMEIKKPYIKSLKDNTFFVENICDPQQLYLDTNKLNLYPLAYVSDLLINSAGLSTDETAHSNIILPSFLAKLSCKRDYDQSKKNIAAASILLVQLLKQTAIPKVNIKVLEQLFAEVTNKPQLIPAVELLCLNYSNNLHCFQWCLLHRQTQLLRIFTYGQFMNAKLETLLELEKSTGVQLVKPMTLSLSQGEKVRLAENFQLRSVQMELFESKIDSLGFLAVLSSSNWRLLMEHLLQQFQSHSLPSLLLQYEEYLHITSTANEYYDQQIAAFTELLSRYSLLLDLKAASMKSDSCPEQQLRLKVVNELASARSLISSSRLKEVLGKMAQLDLGLQALKLPVHKQFIAQCMSINRTLNHIVQGNVMLPTFVHDYRLTSAEVHGKYLVEIGLYLEQYYQITGTCVKEEDIFKPASFVQVNYPQQLIVNDNDKPVYRQCDPQTATKAFNELRERVNQMNSLEDKDKANYLLGSMYFLSGADNKLDPLRQIAVRRQRWSWELLGECEVYKKIKQILSEQNIGEKGIKFSDSTAELVTQINKADYCNQLAQQTIGLDTRREISYFLRGYFNQKYYCQQQPTI